MFDRCRNALVSTRFTPGSIRPGSTWWRRKIATTVSSVLLQERHWLTEQQFVDAVAVAMITPGPVVITVAFIGFLIRGVSGMTVAALAVFLPVYVIVVVAAPSFRRHHERPAIRQFVGGVTAAATGAIAGAAVLLARRALVDPWTIGIAVSTTVIMWRWRVSELWLIAGASVLGLCLH